MVDQPRIWILKVAPILAATILLAEATMAATITVHAPDGEGRVFVDVLGKINDGDFETFQGKTDQVYPIVHPKKQVIVTLLSYGGSITPALQIAELIRRRGMSTFAPADRACTSACAFIWLAGVPRTVGSAPQIGFHAIYDPTTRQETGAGNAVVGAYLRDLRFGSNAIVFMTRSGPASVEWLTPDVAKEIGVSWALLQPPRAIPVPPQPDLQRGRQPPPRVIAAWSKSASQAQAAASQPTDRSGDAPAAPVPGAQPAAQKAVLYEENATGGARFVGSAIWRTETATPGPGQPPELAVRADVEVPERKLALTFTFRRNPDKGLPATHRFEVMFKLPADFSAGGIRNVPGILMKHANSMLGVPLAGFAVKVTPDFYLIGLSDREPDKERNLRLVKELDWFDIPVVYNDDRRAIVAIEKGPSGDRALAEAFNAWEQSGQDAGQIETAAWRRLMIDRLERLKVYPPDARERKEAGVVQVLFSLNRRGELVSSSIAKSSGYPSLDVAALEMIRKGQPFAPPPAHLKGEEVRLSIPIRFQFQELELPLSE